MASDASENGRRMIPGRITILTMGTRGDVNPYVALGCSLQRLGFQVRLATLETFVDQITNAGLEFFELPHPLEGMNDILEPADWQSSPRNLWRGRSILRRASSGMFRLFDRCWEACQGSVAIVSGYAAFASPYIAARLQIPNCWALPQPMTPTGEFPHYLTPWSRNLGSLGNRTTFAVVDRIQRLLFHPVLRRWNQQRLGVRLTRRGSALLPGHGSSLVLYAFSRFVVSKPADWSDDTHITGFWFADQGAPPPELVQFLEQGTEPICFCLGAVHGLNWNMVPEFISRASGLTGRRCVLIKGGRPIPECSSASVISVPYAPHNWLFPRVAAVVHHGGSGTTGEALRAGRPSVILPRFMDQPYWAHAMHRLGVAPAPLFRAEATPEAVARSLSHILAGSAYRNKAMLMAEKIRSEGGAMAAAEILREYLVYSGFVASRPAH